MNEYKEDFDEVVSMHYFKYWMSQHMDDFSYNLLRVNHGTEDKPLREWIKWFLDWSEYNENKLEGESDGN